MHGPEDEKNGADENRSLNKYNYNNPQRRQKFRNRYLYKLFYNNISLSFLVVINLLTKISNTANIFQIELC